MAPSTAAPTRRRSCSATRRPPMRPRTRRPTPPARLRVRRRRRPRPRKTRPRRPRTARKPVPSKAPPPRARSCKGCATVLRRDSACDEDFYYSVRSTGVYCRPSCGARTALRENVRFHETTADARAAGFRPCKRCRPDEPPLAQQHAARIAEACRLIEQADETPSLDALAQTVGLSRYHFHRLFKSVTGLTPKAYADAQRARRMRDELQGSASVTDAIYGAGFNSSGRFYAASSQLLGMTPTQYRAGGEDAAIRFAIGERSLGAILVAATDKGICAITLGDDPAALLAELQQRFPRAQLIGGDAEV